MYTGAGKWDQGEGGLEEKDKKEIFLNQARENDNVVWKVYGKQIGGIYNKAIPKKNCPVNIITRNFNKKIAI